MKPIEPPESLDYWTNDGAAGVATDNRWELISFTVIAGNTKYGWQLSES